ncbi:MAG: hypothetical protein ABIT38_00485 [Gemmatimonadaceae bacterium]
MRHRVIRHLVAHGGLTAVALTSGPPESEAMSRYVTSGPDALPTDRVRISSKSLTWDFSRFADSI